MSIRYRDTCTVVLGSLLLSVGISIAGEAPEKALEVPPEKKSDAPSTKDSGKATDKTKKPVTSTEDWAKRLAKGRKQLEDSYPWAAEQTLRRCFEEAKSFPKGDLRRIAAYIAMADAEAYLGHHETALPKYEIANRLVSELQGPDAIEHIDALLGIADCKRRLNRFADAEPMFLQALDFAGRAKGSTPEIVAKVRFQVEEFYSWSRVYSKAEEYCRIALAEAEKDPKAKPNETLWTRCRLAKLILCQHRLKEGDELVAGLLKDATALFGPEDYRLGEVLSYFGETNASCERDAVAIEQFRAAIAIYDKDPKKFSPGIASDLYEMVECLRRTKQYEEAEKAALRAVELREAARAPPRIIESLVALSRVYEETKRMDQAIATMRKAVAVDEKYYGKNRVAVLDTTQRLAVLLTHSEKFEEAEKLYRGVLETREKYLGPFQFATSRDRFFVAYLSARLGHEQAALEEYRRAAEGMLDARAAMMQGLSEHKRQEWRNSQEWCWRDFFSFCLDRKDRSPEALNMAADAALHYQGSLVGMGMVEREAYFASGDPKLKDLALQIADVRGKIASAYKDGIQGSDPVRDLQALKARQAGLEGEFARSCAAYASEHQIRASGSAEIRKAVPQGSVLVVVLRMELAFRDKGERPFPHYLAFAFEHGGAASFLDLGSAMAIDETLSKFSTSLSDASVRLVQGGAPANEVAHQEAARTLTEQFLAPLYEHLKDKPRWFFCLDGPIATLNVALLPEPGGDALVLERREVSYLTRGSEILGFAPTKLESADLRILADPDFESKADADEQVAMRSGAFAGLKWSRLPGTREEGEALEALFRSKKLKVTMLVGKEASRGALFEGPPPRFLHVATHGFSLPEKFKAEDLENVRGLAGIVDKQDAKSTQARVANFLVCKSCGRIHVKGLRTGLVFAGAGKAGGGVVLAEELQTLNLFGTEMVVLSACESGLGDIAAGEGVQGLRSAFLESGARSLVTSLWKVPDRETKDLMCAFYRHVLAGERKSKALQQAMLELRAAQQKEKGGSHPFYWAGFILVGNPD